MSTVARVIPAGRIRNEVRLPLPASVTAEPEANHETASSIGTVLDFMTSSSSTAPEHKRELGHCRGGRGLSGKPEWGAS